MQGVTKRNSLYFQLIILLVISGAVALAVFYGLNTVGENVVYYYYNHSNYSAKREKNYVAELQNYVSSNELKSSDTDELSQWVTEKAVIISLWLYKDNALIFDSDYPDNATYSSEPAYLDENNGSRFYTIEFADGEVEAGISGVFDYQLYNYASFGEMLLAFSIFILMVLIGIRKKMEYIRKLSKEIQILEGGNLEYKITVTGKDELAALAGGLNCMRESFRRQTIQEAEIVRENQKIVTQMSHDIRTPLTSIMLYTELLKKGTYKNEEQFREYIEKIERKTRRMKQLADNLFEYSLVSSDQEIELEEAENEKILFYDLFSETTSYLEQQGYQVDFLVNWNEVRLKINTDYISRILDNVTSNIQKYADKSCPVTIGSVKNGNMEGFYFENRTAVLTDETESTGVGIQSIKNMMAKMGGRCITGMENGVFRLTLYFPCVP